MVDQEYMWMVRAGEGAYLFDEFKSKNVVAIGWNKVGDLSNEKDSDRIKEIVKEKYPEESKGWINIAAGQINRFRFEFEKGEYVITYDPDERVYLVGKIEGDYEYKEGIIEDYNHIRKVKWLGNVSRDKLTTSTKNTLGAISTIFDVGPDAEKELLQLLKGEEKEKEDEEAEKVEEDKLKEDMIAKSREFIKDKISELTWEEMQELVAGILRGMGYKTMVSPRGSDRGRDIQASPDGLGLEEPRIVVEVKHRQGQMGTNEIRSFIAGLRPGNKGIYVSTGGFSKEAKYEADRATIPITLIDSDRVVELIGLYYDNFDAETKTLIPLTKIYWPT